MNRWSSAPAMLVVVSLLGLQGMAATGVQANPADASARQPVGMPATTASRPRIGLVLGGGGAKGAAHIGVLEVLEELRVPVDCIAATSMGALVGATYAAGSTAGEIDEAVRSIDWGQTLGSLDVRKNAPIERKLAVANYSNTLDLGLKGGKLRGRGGLISAQNVEGLLTELIGNGRFSHDFDDLPIPFRAVATDIIAGEMVVLGEGDLAVAMRASMAIPGVFAPVKVDGRLLADGGLMRNLPVDIARSLCADVVIAVWLASPPPDEDDVLSSLGMFHRALGVMVGDNERQQIATLTDRDVGIAVDVGDIATEDFQRSGEAIDLGRSAAAKYRGELARYSRPVNEYRAWQRGVTLSPPETYLLEEVSIAGTERVNPDYIASQLVTAIPGAEVTISDIVEDTRRIYALGDFERVEYQLSGEEGARRLTVEAEEKPWGPNFLSFDYGIATSDGADLNAIFRIDHRRTWLNGYGGQWENTLQLGRKAILSTSLYQPLDVAQRFFVEPILRYETTLEDLYIDEDKAATFRIDEAFTQVDLGWNVGSRAQFRLGFRHGWQDAKVTTGLPGLPELNRETDSSLQLKAVYDTRDAVGLPRHGTFFSLRYAASQPWFSSDLDYSVIEGVYARAFDLDGNSLSLVIGGAETLSGSTPVSQLIELGGIRTFPGLRPGELRGSGYWFAGSSYAWRIADLQPIFGQALYGGFRLQAGEMRESLDDLDTGVIYGLSGSLSGRTPIGPFVLSLGYIYDRETRLQFSLGRPLPEGSLLDDMQ